MQEFERGGEFDSAGTRIAAKFGGEQNQRGAKSLPAGGQEMGSELADQFSARLQSVAQRGFDQFHVRRDALEGFADTGLKCLHGGRIVGVRWGGWHAGTLAARFFRVKEKNLQKHFKTGCLPAFTKSVRGVLGQALRRFRRRRSS